MKPKSRKRKQVNKEGSDKQAKSEKRSEEKLIDNSSNVSDWIIDYSSPKSVLSSLLEPHKLEDFFSTYWEKQPLVIKCSNNQRMPPKFFSLEILYEILKEHSLNFVDDINACHYIDGKRKNMNGKGRITAKKAADLLNKTGATLQIHQPQRFVSELWKLMEKLECYFNCLVGANVYITPCNSQGLAPHYDDVEVFIIQLEGLKEWKLYKPPIELPREYSKDLSEEEIGEPTHSFTLNPGDLLYMPRGVVHQARNPNSSEDYSTHVTISTYQKHTIGDYLMTVLPAIVDKALKESAEFRRGIPVNSFTPFQVENSIVKKLLQRLPEIVSSSETFTSHAMLQDFMKFRLPPFGVNREEMLVSSPAGNPPQLKSFISLAFPYHVSCILAEESDDDNHCTYLYVYTSVMNDRNLHMMNGNVEDEESSSILKFPSHYAKAMEQLQKCSQSVCVFELSLPTDDEKLNLAMTLWTQHLITVIKKS